MAFQQVNVGAAADDNTGDPLRPAFQKINANVTETQTQLATKANAQETSEALDNQQSQIDDKANQASLTELTQRVQENATAIANVKNATTPAALSGDGLKASTDGTKIDVNHGDGLTVDGGVLAVDPDLIGSIEGKADQEALQAVAETVGENTSRIESLEGSVVDAVDLAGPGLKAQEGKLTPNTGAGLEVSTSNLLQIAADFVATVNGKADEDALLAVAGVVGNLQTDKVDVSAKASSADIQNGVADKWVDAEGLVQYMSDRFAIIYPNGGNATSPASVTINTRYTMANPFPGHEIDFRIQLQYGGEWSCVASYNYYNSGGIGIVADVVNDVLRIQTGSYALFGSPAGTLNVFVGASQTTTAPCRIKVWRVD